MLSKGLLVLSLIFLLGCKPQKAITPVNFYFRSITVNGQQSGGFQYANVDLKPTITVSFSNKLSKDNLSENVQLIDVNSALPILLDLSFINNDSTLQVTPKSQLKHLTKYDFLVKNQLKDQAKTILNTDLKVGINTGIDPADKFERISDDALLTLVQKQTFKYFYDFGHPVSGLARERNTSGDVVTSGGSGFGIMAMVVGVERNFITREQGVDRMLKITDFLLNKTKSYHGIFPHWINGSNGETVPFSQFDDGADIVETSYLMQGLLTARQYFNKEAEKEKLLTKQINTLWENANWAWHTKNGEDILYWHWSPNYEWRMNHKITGWNEALITYFMAASSPTFPIKESVYTSGWSRNGAMKNGKSFYDIKLPLGEDFGGPLFFSQYTFMSLDPRNLKDQFADYWEQNVAQSKINYAYCLANPKGYTGYGKDMWGLTASDNDNGYSAHSPTNDLGIITPTAALSAMPYTPNESMDALRYFYYKLGDKTFKEYGFIDSFNMSKLWWANSFLAIDQGPIICMIENHRTGLLWDLFMSCPEVKKGLTSLEFQRGVK